jgi:hypothetical protein
MPKTASATLRSHAFIASTAPTPHGTPPRTTILGTATSRDTNFKPFAPHSHRITQSADTAADSLATVTALIYLGPMTTTATAPALDRPTNTDHRDTLHDLISDAAHSNQASSAMHANAWAIRPPTATCSLWPYFLRGTRKRIYLMQTAP